MKTVKTLLALVLAMLMVLSLAACSGDSETPATTAAATQPATTASTDPVVTVPPQTGETGPATEPEDTNPVYTVTVVDEGGNPVAGAMVQLCDEACYPGVTDAQGVATYSLQEANYKVSFLTIPEGFETLGGETEFYFDAGSYEMTITLKAVA